MSFSTPIALVLLVVLPVLAWIGRPRLAYRRRRDLASVLVRLIIVSCLILALAGLQRVQAADRLAVVFLLDNSDSISPAARDQAQTYIRDALSHMSPDDRAGVIVFGQNALVERPLSNAKDLAAITSAPISLNTNVAGAIRLALAMFPGDAAKRVVLLSDGDETRGSALEAAQLAAATNVQIDTVPLPQRSGQDMAVTNVRLPSKVNTGEQFDVGVTVQSGGDASATLTLLAGGAVVAQKVVQLKAGANNFVFTLTVKNQGFDDFRVRVDPITPDTFYQNNELSGFTEVTGPPRVLLVSPKPEETAALLPALQNSGVQVDIVAPGDLPTGLAALASYKSVILANVSATTALTMQRMKLLQTYVRDLGGGLVVIGGPDSYGVGGYFQTPLEETLPVEMRIKDEKRIPKLTMVYVIDRSGSMEEVGPSGVTNLELAKEAARRSIAFLYPQDRAGVLSFDSNPEWLVPIQNVTNRDAMNNQIGSLRPGGGTDIFAAVKVFAEALPADPSTLKHVILLTDGGADPTGIVDMVAKLNKDYGVTVSTIGIGSGVPPFMADIAKAGKGIYYNLVDLQTIPQIFTAETVLATRSYIVESEFNAKQTADTPMLTGITALPSLLGYVATTAKDTAIVSLSVPGYDDPLLASWQYGLGRAVAFTSDATARWAKNWTSWDQFGRFWSQVVHYTVGEGSGNKLESHVEQRGDQSVLVVDARDINGAYLNSLNLQASVVDPKLGAQAIALQQVAPGRYEIPIDPHQEGSYFIRVGGSNPNDPASAAAQTTGWVLSYSPEYRLHATNFGLLDDLGRLTAGETLVAHPEKVFAHDLSRETAATPVWPILLLLAILLLPLDIALRRLSLTADDLRRAEAWLRARLGVRRLTPAFGTVGAASSPRLSRLMDAKERAAAATPASNGNVPTMASAPDQPASASLTPEPPKEKPAPVLPAAKPGTTANTLASRLVAERKKRGG